MRQFYTSYKQKFSNPRPLLSIIFPQGFQKSKKMDLGTKRCLNKVNKWRRKKSIKPFFCRGNFAPFMNKSFQIWGHFFVLLFPNTFKNLKSLDMWLQEGGGKKTVKWSEKHRYQNPAHWGKIWLIESICPEVQCLEKPPFA